MTAVLVALWRALAGGGERAPFLLAAPIFALSLLGLGISVYPYAVPYRLTIQEAAASDPSLTFLLAGVGVMLPVVLAYTGYNYWVFRGKLGKSVAYH